MGFNSGFKGLTIIHCHQYYRYEDGETYVKLIFKKFLNWLQNWKLLNCD